MRSAIKLGDWVWISYCHCWWSVPEYVTKLAWWLLRIFKIELFALHNFQKVGENSFYCVMLMNTVPAQALHYLIQSKIQFLNYITAASVSPWEVELKLQSLKHQPLEEDLFTLDFSWYQRGWKVKTIFAIKRWCIIRHIWALLRRYPRLCLFIISFSERWEKNQVVFPGIYEWGKWALVA